MGPAGIHALRTPGRRAPRRAPPRSMPAPGSGAKISPNTERTTSAVSSGTGSVQQIALAELRLHARERARSRATSSSRGAASTPTTRAPRAAASRAALPVPQARSSTRSRACGCAASTTARRHRLELGRGPLVAPCIPVHHGPTIRPTGTPARATWARRRERGSRRPRARRAPRGGRGASPTRRLSVTSQAPAAAVPSIIRSPYISGSSTALRSQARSSEIRLGRSVDGDHGSWPCTALGHAGGPDERGGERVAPAGLVVYEFKEHTRDQP